MHKAVLFIQQIYICQFGKIIRDRAAQLPQLNIFTDVGDVAFKYSISRIWFSEAELYYTVDCSTSRLLLREVYSRVQCTTVMSVRA